MPRKGIHRDPLVSGRRPVFFLARLLAFCSSNAGARVQSDCLLPGILAALSQDSLVFLSRALRSRPSQTDTTRSSGQITVFSRKPELWNSSCVHPQAGPDSSEAPDTSGAQVSHGVSLFQVGVPGAIVSGSFVRDPVFSHEIQSTPWTGYSSRVLHGSGATWLPGPARPALPVMVTSGPEDQESGQSSESGQWSPGQDSLLMNRIFSWIAKNTCPTLHLCCTLLFGSQGATDR